MTDKQNALASEAFTRGRRAGLQGLLPSLNPFAAGSVEAAQWEQGRQAAESDANNYANQKLDRERWEDDGWLYAGRTSSRGMR